LPDLSFRDAYEPNIFASPAELRQWFEKNHDREKELLVGFYKVGSPKPSITWSEAVDQALCFGWIDGIRRSIDGESYQNRFTPRKPKSNRSGVNIRKVEALIAQGLMHPAGLASYALRQEARSRVYSYQMEPHQLAAEFEARFKANPGAWDFFQSQAPYYRRLCINRVMSAKQEKTRISRLESLIQKSAAGRKD
jgi:uncharacterized protein YdeI (YjbR/CyaY-like superfamily)